MGIDKSQFVSISTHESEIIEPDPTFVDWYEFQGLRVPVDRNVWDRLPDEPELWYGRFHTFLSVGSARTLIEAQRRLQAEQENYGVHVISEFYLIAKRWKWKERAAAWDEAQFKLERDLMEEARLKNRAKRIALLDKLHNKLDQAVDNLDPEHVSWRTVAEGVKIVVSEQRQDYNDLPTQRRELSGDDGGPIEVKDVSNARETLANMIRDKIQREEEAKPYVDTLKALMHKHDNDAVEGEVINDES